MPGTPFFYVIDGDGVIANAGFAGTLEQLETLTAEGLTAPFSTMS